MNMFEKKINFIREKFRKKSYGLVGKTSAVQICHWTKQSLRGKKGCWKQKFYGIDSSRCCQFSPAVMWCENNCVHCWRPLEFFIGKELPYIDEPEDIIEGIIKERKKLLSGFGGKKGINKEKLKKAMEPHLFTLSLSGEATLYPKLPELIKLIKKKNAICFLVTNGQNPEMLKKLEQEDSLPTQLTISVNAPNKELFLKWHNSLNKDSWERLNKSLEMVKEFEGKCRRCFRLTLVKKGKNKNSPLNYLTNMEEKNIKEYVALILKAYPNFIHVKGYTSIGSARNRMGYDKQPTHEEIKKYSKKLLFYLNKNLIKKEKPWKILGEDKVSCVVVIGKSKKEMKIKI
ncbi:MAG: radical SAM protein [Candidatus Pacearchaeota archaeon]